MVGLLDDFWGLRGGLVLGLLGLVGLFLSSPFLSSALVTSPMPSAVGSGS